MTAERLPGVPSPAVPRNGAVDVLKALAIVGTVTIHASTAAYYDGFGSLPWLSAILWGTISRWAVPVFFLCSGALLLDPDRDLSLSGSGPSLIRSTACCPGAFLSRVSGRGRRKSCSSTTSSTSITCTSPCWSTPSCP